MVAIDTIEGIIDDILWYHYDVGNDVLYLQTVSTRGKATFGEETPEGFILFRDDDDQVAGMTVIGWWERFGTGELDTTSLASLKNRVAESAQNLTVAA